MDFSGRDVTFTNVLAESFYRIVPLELRTFCSVTSRISRSVLQHFGVAAELLPCQMWLVTPEKSYVVGFVGKSPKPGKWDGHVVCATHELIVDAAVENFTRDFDLQLPRIVACQRFNVPSQVIARRILNTQNELWWYHPPGEEQADPRIPIEPPELIDKYAARLIDYISTTMPVVMADVTPDLARVTDKNTRQKI